MVVKQILNTLLILCFYGTALSLSANMLVDPTRPAARQKSTISGHSGTAHRGWKLESTLVARDRRVAVINGKLVSEGESVDGARVIKIRKFEVLVKTPDSRITLQLLPDYVKKNP